MKKLSVPKASKVTLGTEGKPSVNPPDVSRRIHIGIDPGESGAIAILDPRKDEPYTYPMPKLESVLLSILRTVVYDTGGAYQIRLVLEQVGGYISLRNSGGAEGKEGYVNHPGSRMFSFGQNYGTIRTALVAAGLQEGIHWKTVTPSVWQRGLGVTPKRRDEKREEHKRKLRTLAQELFPDITATLKNADALLIAEYCLRNSLELFPQSD